jgi:LmbE family N-acetylglucosaminyl deacetylase
MSSNKIALSLLAHPDDAEFLCTGTLALLRQRGWQIHIATITAGDCGSMDMNNQETARVRKAEAAQAAAILDGQYHCLDIDDAFVMYDKPSLLATISLIRKVKPTLVFGTNPADYSIDHETTSRLAWAACFAAGIPNVKTDGSEPLHHIPHLYYLDVLFGKDNWAKEITADFVVDIGSVTEIKEQMLCCHKSQRDWLLAYHGMDKYVEIMKQHSQMRGKQAGIGHAEAFRQHLGHSFPQDNLLATELAGFVHTA